MLERYADLFGHRVDEVVEWVNSYVNNPELATHPEPTEKERFESIKAYIQRRIATAADTRIRRSIETSQRAAA